MTLVVNSDLAAATVTYNGVQFGGGDAVYESTPPNYSFQGEFEYDDSGRAIIGTVYTLSVTCVFTEATEAGMAHNAETIRRRLAVPRAVLKIVGLGTGFETVSQDHHYGPKPLGFSWTPLGPVAWECHWQVQFHLKDCLTLSQDHLAFLAFNFDTTWQNDFEGLCQRTIAGYAQIGIHFDDTAKKIPHNVADNVRDRINIICPNGFRRVQNTWRENATKNRIDFVVTDEVMPGTPLPQGCILAQGDVSYDSQGPGFANAQVTLSMFLKTSPSFAPSLAGLIFLTAAKTKQESMSGAIGNRANVVPMHIHISNGKFDRARETSASMTWALTKCIGSMMKAAGIWEPLVPDTYALWRSSIQNLWNNRGAVLVGGSPIGSIPAEAFVIDLCDNVTSVTIGASAASTSNYPNREIPFSFTCPDVPEDGGWLGHDLRVRILRKDEQSWHKRAVSYLPVIGQVTGGSQYPDRVPLGGPAYTQDQTEQHVVEYHGKPAVYILLQFRGLRLKRLPKMPELKDVGGLPVHLVEQQTDGPRIAFDAICPVHFIRGYRIYRVNGYVPTLKAVESETSCAAPNGGSTQY